MTVDIKITDLTLGSTLDGTELFECVQGGVSRKIPSNSWPLLNYGYLTLNTQPQLINSRKLTAGSNIAITDGGPLGNLTITASLGAGTPVYWTTYQSVTLPAGNTNNQVLTADIVVLRVTPNAAGSNLTGIDSTANSGRMVVILNVGAAGDLNLINQSASSSAANRFTIVGGFDLAIPPGGNARVWYDSVSSTWRPV